MRRDARFILSALSLLLTLPGGLAAQDTEREGRFTASVTPWVEVDDQGGGHVVERGTFAGDAVVEEREGTVLLKLCDAERGWFANYAFRRITDGVESLEPGEYSLERKPGMRVTAAADIPSGERIESGTLALKTVTSELLAGTIRTAYVGSASVRLVSGEPPAGYALEAAFRARVVPAATPENAPGCFPRPG